jgi:endonuclease/exonuclease/phosphatase family metal-dependent hydrolase
VTHLCAEKSSEGERSRVAQVGELCAWLQAAAERWDAAATVALLDMNGAPRSTNNKYEPAAYPAAVGGRLRSAYQLVLGAEPAWTTWKRRGGEELKMTLDYVLVSPEVTCHRVLLPPDDADVDSERLPGWRYPSDHVMLAAELSVVDG